MSFLAPERLWLLLLVPALAAAYLLLQWRRRAYTVRFTNLALLATVAPRRPAWRRHVAAALTGVTVALLVAAFAQPQDRVRVPRERATIVVAIDVSLSMKARDVTPTRLAAAQRAASAFVDTLPARFNVALVSYAGTASILVSPTTDRGAVQRAIDGLTLAESTATGEAIYTSLQAVRQVPPDPAHPNDPAPARIVLLSDGYQNVGRSSDEAAASARRAGVPISTIAFGTPYGVVEIGGQQAPVPVDEESMRRIAEETGGHAYTARSTAELGEVYNDIGSSVGFTEKEREITARFVGIALVSALAAAGASLLFFGRLP